MAAVTHGSDGTGMQNMLHRTSPVMADFVAKVAKYQATIFSKETKLNNARRLIWHPGRQRSRL
jgi:hypothetical protein